MPEELSFISSSQLCVAAQRWGGAGQPVLALHGWLDNAASFAVLAPLLAGCDVVALDMPGHGFSDHRHAQGTYNLWDDLSDILDVLDELGWQRCVLLGHSRGAMIATLLAAIAPERFSHLCLLDAVVPPPVAASEAPEQLAKHVRDYRRKRNRDIVYADIDEAISARQKSGLSEQAARLIVERGIKNTDAGVVWRSDPRLRGASAMRLSLAQSQAFIEKLPMPALALLAKQGMGADEAASRWLSGFAQLHVEVLDGAHHFHMEQEAPCLAEKILAFIADHRKVS